MTSDGTFNVYEFLETKGVTPGSSAARLLGAALLPNLRRYSTQLTGGISVAPDPRYPVDMLEDAWLAFAIQGRNLELDCDSAATTRAAVEASSN